MKTATRCGVRRAVRQIALAAACLAVAAGVHARDTQLPHSIKDALNTEDGKKLDPSIRLFFGNQPTPPIEKRVSDVATNKKANAFARADETACRRAFASAMITLQEAARNGGGNAVVNIRSNYRGVESSSETEYVCGAGGIIAGAAFKGTIVKLAQ